MATRKSDEAPQPQITMVQDTISQDTLKNADDALEFLRKEEIGDEGEYVDEKKLVRKIDWMVMPLMFLCYFLEYLDKSLCKYRRPSTSPTH